MSKWTNDKNLYRRPDDPEAHWNKPRKGRGKKDRRRWCRGKEGVEHVPEVVMNHHYADRKCRWLRWDPERWLCLHVEQCQRCGKKLRHLGADECPDRERVPPVSGGMHGADEVR